MGTFKSAQKSAKKSVFANKSAQKSTLKSTFGSSEPIWSNTDKITELELTTSLPLVISLMASVIISYCCRLNLILKIVCWNRPIWNERIFNFLSAATEQLVRIRAREKAKLVRWTCTLHIFLSALANGKKTKTGILLKSVGKRFLFVKTWWAASDSGSGATNWVAQVHCPILAYSWHRECHW